jgi:hypothetical protein
MQQPQQRVEEISYSLWGSLVITIAPSASRGKTHGSMTKWSLWNSIQCFDFIYMSLILILFSIDLQRFSMISTKKIVRLLLFRLFFCSKMCSLRNLLLALFKSLQTEHKMHLCCWIRSRCMQPRRNNINSGHYTSYVRQSQMSGFTTTTPTFLIQILWYKKWQARSLNVY